MPSGQWPARRFLRAVPALAAVVAAALPAAGVRAADDPLLAEQWGLHTVGAPAAWATSRGESVTVAVIDTGVDLDHEDLVGQVATSVACLGTLGDQARCAGAGEDDDGHGTHVAGLLAATAGNGKGGAGVAPAARLMVIRALRRTCVSLPGGVPDCHGYGNTLDVSAAVRWAVDHGAHVVNLSWAEDQSPLSDGSVADAIAYAWSRGVIAVMASGNDAGATDGVPRDPVPAIVVTGTTRDGRRAAYANGVDDRARWALAAPGGDGSGACPAGDVLSTFSPPDGPPGYGCLGGTSMASPHVSGAVALLRSLGLSAQETVDRLLATARDAGLPGPDAEYGSGILDVAAAVAGVTRRPGGPDGTGPPAGGPAATSGDGAGTPAAPAPAVPPREESGETAAPPPGTSPPFQTGAAAPEVVAPPADRAPALPSPAGAGEPGSRRGWALAAAALAAAAGLAHVPGRRRALTPRRRG